MHPRALLPVLLSLAIVVLASGQAMAEEIRIAVASNFANVIKILSVRFEAATGHKVALIYGSTGKHYAQIRNGAPFDAFFAADIKRPELLEKAGFALPGSRFTYARGKIVLWSPRAGYIGTEGEVLAKGAFDYLAIANPGLAPYGKAAEEVLRARGLWDELKTRVVRGENIGQAFQFVNSGNAELGLVAWSQLRRNDAAIGGSYWLVPGHYYSPIEQQAILLQDTVGARMFMSFIRGDDSARIIRAHGYELP